MNELTEINLRPINSQPKKVTKHFTYNDIIIQRLNYQHDGSETIEDSFDVQVIIVSAPKLNKKFLMSNVYSIPIMVEAVNDLPNLSVGFNGPVINLFPGSK